MPNVQVQAKIEDWKKRLLDFSKKNLLINLKETTLKITSPEIQELYKSLVDDEQSLAFPFPVKSIFDELEDDEFVQLKEGDISTSIDEISKLQNTLRRLRNTARIHNEERGVNALYLSFGTLEWNEKDNSKDVYHSPVILVPARLTVANIKSPYRLSVGEEEIVLNPTLVEKMNLDFGFKLPEFKPDDNYGNIEEYLDNLQKCVKDKQWTVKSEVSLAIMSFQKLNMYKDLEKHGDLIEGQPMLASLAGVDVEIEKESIDDYVSYNHDDDSPEECFQIVDADSSQMDAIKLARKGFSFVLQGPPGTGKSQTITNIIAEALADGKKVLFVSEKMAALQVVYNRMAAAKLSEFCLSMHDAKMKKTEFLKNLKDTLHASRTRLSNNQQQPLSNLKLKRADINKYPIQLHTKFSKLDITPYFANGKLANLESEPDIFFPIDSPEEWNKEDLSSVLDTVSQLQAAIDGATLPIIENPWVNSVIPVITNDKRQVIEATLHSLKMLLEKILEISQLYDISCDLKVNEVGKLYKLLCKAADSPLFKHEWLDMDVGSLIDEVNNLQKLSDDYAKCLSSVLENFQEGVISIDIKNVRKTSETAANDIRNVYQVPNDSSLGDFIESIFSDIVLLHNDLGQLYNYGCSLSEQIGAKKPVSIEDLSNVLELARILNRIDTRNIPIEWLNRTFNASNLRNLISMHNQVNKAEKDILVDYDREILSIDYLPMLKAFRTSYVGFFGKLKSGYRKDIKLLKACRRNSATELDYKEAVRILELVHDYRHKLEDVQEKQSYCSKIFGPLYHYLQTDWETVERYIAAAEKLHEYIGPISQNVRDVICLGQIAPDVIDALYMDQTLDAYKSILEKFNSVNSLNIEDLLSKIKNFELAAKNYRKAIGEVSVFCLHPMNDVELNEFIKIIDRIDDTTSYFKANNERFNNIFGTYYTGIDTAWNTILSPLQYLSELKELDAFCLCTLTIMGGISSSIDFVRECGDNAKELNRIHCEAVPLINEFIRFFDDNEDLYCMPLTSFAQKVKKCANYKESLQDWINFNNANQKLEERNIKEFSNSVIKQGIHGVSVVKAFEKRFYNLWLDSAAAHFDAVQNFQGARRNQNLEDFRNLDKKQFGIAIARIRENLFKNMPNIDRPTAAEDETSILKREMSKSRKIMPLRKLFSAVPNIILDIKPCFMMSPLSVSVFLDADSYNFDMVIFDEASQVCTEDAVGAIMRGKQIIIVGDSNQLPPTNFFKSNYNSESDDFDDEDDDKIGSQQLETVLNTNGAYQSILEEAMTVLNNHILRWHYRSRHEDLIAFSNYKIYDGDLITFPSSSERTPDNGVEFIQVNGVYGYGGKRVNKEEAQKVADLVFDHFRKYPERSLGVIANSVAQQDAIEAAIRKKRQEDDSYEEFFAEDSQEPFFIKNLETVQGDERDTIIYSIGYGKDAHGKMHMNFGPLNSADGHRRLNVAITRAKYNLKLVGSITHTDIDTSHTSNKGVSMMRSYIEFAMRGVESLGADIDINNDAECESPFEQSVYDFLKSKGYEVVRQVGCSGYRIDLAVKHPMKASNFVLAIECDGASYHSSRTARERDRLRQEVLESIGWTFHRIWSTDWVKNPALEKRNLVEAIQNALSNPLDIHPANRLVPNEIPEETIKSEFEPTLFSEPDYYSLGFKPYTPASTSQIMLPSIIVDIIKKEQPLSLYTLCKAVADAVGKQNVTESVKKEVRDNINLVNDKISRNNQRNNTTNAEIVIDDDNCIYFDNIDHVEARIPDQYGDNRRDITNIPMHEIWKAIHLIIINSRGVTKEHAVIAVARAFGFKSTKVKLQTVISQAIDMLLELGLYSMVDEKLTPNESAIESSKYAYIFK